MARANDTVVMYHPLCSFLSQFLEVQTSGSAAEKVMVQGTRAKIRDHTYVYIITIEIKRRSQN